MRRSRTMLPTVVGALLVAGSVLVASAPPGSSAGVESGYIVVLDPALALPPRGEAALADELARSIDAPAAVDLVYDDAIAGFSVRTTEAGAAELAADPRVDYVEPDRPVALDAQFVPNGVTRIRPVANPSLDIDGIDDARVDVDVAVIDTGIDLQHPDLNVAGGVTCTSAGPCSSGGDDQAGHGTHVAGTIGAIDDGSGVVGVAPGARLWAVRVFDSAGAGLLSWVLNGVDWVTAHASTIEVANMSLGTDGFSRALYDAVQAAVDAGVAFAVSAGNSHLSAAGFSPASFDNVLTVSAINDFDGLPGGLATSECAIGLDDSLASYSNFGPVDVAAPGSCVVSTIPIELGSYGIASGTSMASPHVAGALALLARAGNPNSAADVAALYGTVLAEGNTRWVDNSGDGVTEPLLDISDRTVFGAASVASCAIATVDPLAWWTGDDTLTGRAGPTLTGAAAFGAGKIGRGLTLDGHQTLTVSGFPTLTTAVSVDAWVKPTNTGVIQAIVGRWNYPSATDGVRVFELLIDPAGRLSWATDETSTRWHTILEVAAPQLYDGNFHHIAATWDHQQFAVYVDGALLGNKVSQGGTLNPAPTTTMWVGNTSGIGSWLPFVGSLDEVTIWDRALTADEVGRLSVARVFGKCRPGA